LQYLAGFRLECMGFYCGSFAHGQIVFVAMQE
jgi:hypothetical protein